MKSENFITNKNLNQYPDVLSVDELQKVLRIGRSATYALLKTDKIKALKFGKKYIIPKQSVIDFLNIN